VGLSPRYRGGNGAKLVSNVVIRPSSSVSMIRRLYQSQDDPYHVSSTTVTEDINSVCVPQNFEDHDKADIVQYWLLGTWLPRLWRQQTMDLTVRFRRLLLALLGGTVISHTIWITVQAHQFPTIQYCQWRSVHRELRNSEIFAEIRLYAADRHSGLATATATATTPKHSTTNRDKDSYPGPLLLVSLFPGSVSCLM